LKWGWQKEGMAKEEVGVRECALLKIKEALRHQLSFCR